jgi:hypothetical protein
MKFQQPNNLNYKKYAALILLFLFSGSCFAQPPFAVANFSGEFNLDMSGLGKPGHPYARLPNYNRELIAQGSGPEFLTPISRHDIIPYSTLLAFFPCGAGR